MAIVKLAQALDREWRRLRRILRRMDQMERMLSYQRRKLAAEHASDPKIKKEGKA